MQHLTTDTIKWDKCFALIASMILMLMFCVAGLTKAVLIKVPVYIFKNLFLIFKPLPQESYEQTIPEGERL